MPVVASAEARTEQTLCHAFEEIYFSCQMDRKIVSICASGNISPDNGYVQYRYGTVNQLDLQYPDVPLSPRHRIAISDTSGGNAQYTHVKFRQSGFDYVLYQGFPSGLYVKKNGRTVFNKTCQPGEFQKLSQRAYRGIETVAPQDGVDQ
ncbi:MULTISPECIES: hypothetical protein [unclassified Caballeronia]|uniref:hypothetical protein n=1 Tax=unclassified Caballeronia TaxID=2646786 RepID=UPI002028E02D|nr:MULTISPECIES: hypothetical protein [unclassified Caballeronia]